MTVFLCQSKSVSVTDSLCMWLTVRVHHRSVCVCQRQFVSTTDSWGGTMGHFRESSYAYLLLKKNCTMLSSITSTTSIHIKERQQQPLSTQVWWLHQGRTLTVSVFSFSNLEFGCCGMNESDWADRQCWIIDRVAWREAEDCLPVQNITLDWLHHNSPVIISLPVLNNCHLRPGLQGHCRVGSKLP